MDRKKLFQSQTISVRYEDYYNLQKMHLAVEGKYTILFTISQMEGAIIRAKGSPPESIQANLELAKIPTKEWDQILADLSRHGRPIYTALTYIDHQRIYEKEGVSIIYSVFNFNENLHIVFGSLGGK